MSRRIILLIMVFLVVSYTIFSQSLNWAADGNSYYSQEDGGIVQTELPGLTKKTILAKDNLIPQGKTSPLRIEGYKLSNDLKKVLIYTNSKRVWRQNTKGDYWVYDFNTKQLKQLGKGRPESTLMFAKFSPDGAKVAYVSERNIYVEVLSTGSISKLTDDLGTKKLINGTFDWVYEEEFFCRDGFRWGNDSKSIAYWQIDANKISDFYMINNVDSIYSRIIPVEYPKVGFPPSPARIGVVDIVTKKTTWMKIAGDPAQNYLIRMEWTPDGKEIIVQQLNRKQNESKLLLCNPKTGVANTIQSESDEAWVSTINEWSSDATGWDWIDNGKGFLWLSEKDGWRHVYKISRDGKNEMLLTKGNYDVISLEAIDEINGFIYFMASPDNATQQYLYRAPMNGNGDLQPMSPQVMKGTHSYSLSPNGKWANHSFTNYFTPRLRAWVSLPDHKPLAGQDDVVAKYKPEAAKDSKVEFFQVTTADGVTLDGWIAKPTNFNPVKKYPIVFSVYGEPASSTVHDNFGVGRNRLYTGDMAADGYLYVSIDNRGTPSPKGRAWRKAIYRKLGVVNIRDLAMGAKKVLEWPFVDTSRVAVHGWSGGGSSTLNLMFQYPEIFKTGISIAPVTNSLFYDNIYTERYMGLPQENMSDYVAGAATTHAKNLRGNLLLVHGTTDDNVHFQNAEMLVNELVKHNKLFQYMAYPGRSHGIFEGEGTSRHLANMFTDFLRRNCPPGAK